MDSNVEQIDNSRILADSIYTFAEFKEDNPSYIFQDMDDMPGFLQQIISSKFLPQLLYNNHDFLYVLGDRYVGKTFYITQFLNNLNELIPEHIELFDVFVIQKPPYIRDKASHDRFVDILLDAIDLLVKDSVGRKPLFYVNDILCANAISSVSEVSVILESTWERLDRYVKNYSELGSPDGYKLIDCNEISSTYERAVEISKLWIADITDPSDIDIDIISTIIQIIKNRLGRDGKFERDTTTHDGDNHPLPEPLGRWAHWIYDTYEYMTKAFPNTSLSYENKSRRDALRIFKNISAYIQDEQNFFYQTLMIGEGRFTSQPTPDKNRKPVNKFSLENHSSYNNPIENGNVNSFSAVAGQNPLLGSNEFENPNFISDLSEFKANLTSEIYGQDQAIDSLVDSLAPALAGLTPTNRPLSTILMAGPTGVGKTETVLSVAKHIADRPLNLVRVDMSEYKRLHEVAKFIGSPPGYVGSDTTVQFLESVASNPYSIILLDEVEKAHPAIWDIFLQVFDAARLTSGKGQVVDFSKTLIFMTTNIGAKSANDSGTYQEEYDNNPIFQNVDSVEDNRARTVKAIKEYFKPEFINRIDTQIVFDTLTRDVIEKIVSHEIEKLNNLASNQRFKIDELSDDVINFIADKSNIEEYGAREIQRSIKKYITLPLSKVILQNPNTSNYTKVYGAVVSDDEDISLFHSHDVIPSETPNEVHKLAKKILPPA